jgi:hypothetical protein
MKSLKKITLSDIAIVLTVTIWVIVLVYILSNTKIVY